MRHKSSDGLLSSSEPGPVATWNQIGEDMRASEAAWDERLLDMGVKLAHPDDDWVDRARNFCSPSYPRFDLKPAVGDLIALGYGYRKHWDGDFHYRICRVTKVEEWGVISRSMRYHFVDTGERV